MNSQRISFLSLVKNCNHKGLGIYYLLSAFIFGISGTLISVLIRIELYSSGNRIISPENQNFYNISITLHGFLMIFFLVMPGLFGGFGNYFVPIFQGSPEVVYPRVNNFSILILIVSYLFFILSLISEFGGGTGWTLYPPLSTSFLSLSPSSTGNLIFGLLISGISSCLTSLNFWTTIINLRSYYLTLKTMPLFLWSLLITGGMLLVEGGNNLILKQLFLDFLSSAVPFCPRNHDCEARSRDGRLTVYSRIIIWVNRQSQGTSNIPFHYFLVLGLTARHRNSSLLSLRTRVAQQGFILCFQVGFIPCFQELMFSRSCQC